ncbi:MAG: non-ribosomal peptide synthetase, partial [Dactylosporangium sp.]|nr:hypothetical protein [Dactylosporangium sp.]NNJ59427.1 non-ribosomal peptide synthetase [Dactylosporangium sp.]
MTQVSDLQHGIWFTETTGGASTAYALAVALDLTGPLDLTALETACQSVVSRHEALRLAVAESDAGPRLVEAGAPPRLERRVHTADLVDSLLATPFDLARGPLVRMILAERSPERHLLVVVAHHLVFDGMSKEILVRDLAAAYRPGPADPGPPGAEDRPAAGSPIAPPRFVDLIETQRKAIERELPAAREFWSRTGPTVPARATLP